MPVFDFSNSKTEKKDPECTYTTFQSNEKVPSPEKPILIIDNKSRQWKHHSCGVFSNPGNQKSSFEFKEQDGVFPADILKIDARFVSLVKWLGENHISVRLSGQNTEDGYAIYKIRETAFGGAGKAFSRRWISAVYDRTSSGKQCTGRAFRMEMRKMKTAMI